MMPDVKKEEQTGWLVLAGTAVVALIALWIISDGGALAEQAEEAQAGLSVGGSEDMAVHVERQVQANDDMRKTIEQLKSQTDFILAEEFVIRADERQPGYFFKRKFVEVRERLRNKAEARRIAYDQNIGFGADPAVPPDDQAPYLLTMLQLTEKIVGIAFDSERPLESLNVSHGPAVDTGPETRPVLVREYPLRLEIRGSLKDILGILHRISRVDQPTKDVKLQDYPLLLRGFSHRGEKKDRDGQI